jgi:pilus assembly protein Flp/PilA
MCHGEKAVNRSPILPSPFFAPALTDLLGNRPGVRVSRAAAHGWRAAATRANSSMKSCDFHAGRAAARAGGIPVAIWQAVTRRRAAIDSKQHAATPHNRTDIRCRCLGGGIMSNLINFVKTFSNKEDGQDLLEYALLVALIALIAIGAVGLAGGSVNTIFTTIAGSLAAAA